jgi:ABC-type nitrate/sulfonate/bicarbonate transport system ATPase subunit
LSSAGPFAPPILISGLDAVALEDVMKLLVDVGNLHELNTILVVTNDIRAAMAVSDTVYMLGRDRKDDGKLVPGACIQATYDLVALDLA